MAGHPLACCLFAICLPLATLPSPSPPPTPTPQVQVPDPKISAWPWAPQLGMAPQWIYPLLLDLQNGCRGQIRLLQQKSLAVTWPFPHLLSDLQKSILPLSLCLPWDAVWWVLPPLLLRLVPWFGLSVPSRVSSGQAGQPLCLGRVPMCWQPRVLVFDGISVESSQVLLGAQSGQHNRRR